MSTTSNDYHNKNYNDKDVKDDEKVDKVDNNGAYDHENSYHNVNHHYSTEKNDKSSMKTKITKKTAMPTTEYVTTGMIATMTSPTTTTIMAIPTTVTFVAHVNVIAVTNTHRR